MPTFVEIFVSGRATSKNASFKRQSRRVLVLFADRRDVGGTDEILLFFIGNETHRSDQERARAIGRAANALSVDRIDQRYAKDQKGKHRK